MGRQPKSSTGASLPGGVGASSGAGGSSSSLTAATNHALELDPNHRRNLASSLDRCDVEIAALDRLHDTLRILRDAIVERYGELALFPPTRDADDADGDGDADGGDGPSGGDGVEGSKAEKNEKEEDGERERLLGEFRLRMRLRRRLLNRLSRRLNRLAHMMDGETVVPPQPPKYGDVRYRVDTVKRDEFLRDSEKREEALAELRNRARVRAAEGSGFGGDGGEDGTAALARALSSPMVDGDGGSERERALREALVEYEPVVAAGAEGPGGDGTAGWDGAAEPEYAAIKYGAGIGAAHRSMSNREKEADHARWRADVLARVPRQPTFAELGMGDDVVFREGERRRRIAEGPRPKKEEEKEEEDEDGQDGDESEDDDDEEDEESKSNTEMEDGDDDTEASESESASQGQADEEDGEDADAQTNEARGGGGEKPAKVPAEADSDTEMEESDGVAAPMQKSEEASAGDGCTTRAGEGETAVANSDAEMGESDGVEARPTSREASAEDGGAGRGDGDDSNNAAKATPDADLEVKHIVEVSGKSDDDDAEEKAAAVDAGADSEGGDKVEGIQKSEESLTEDKNPRGGEGGDEDDDDADAEGETASIDGDAGMEGGDEKGAEQTAEVKSVEASTDEKGTPRDGGDDDDAEEETAAIDADAEMEGGDKVETGRKSDGGDADEETAPVDGDSAMGGGDNVDAIQKSEEASAADTGTRGGEGEGEGKGSDDKAEKETAAVDAIADAKAEVGGGAKVPLQPSEEASGTDSGSGGDGNDKADKATDVIADADAADPDAEMKQGTMAEAGTGDKAEEVVVDDESGGEEKTGEKTSTLADSVAADAEMEDAGNATKAGKEKAAEASADDKNGSKGDEGDEGEAGKTSDAAPAQGTEMEDGEKVQTAESTEAADDGKGGDAVDEDNTAVDEDVEMEDGDMEQAGPPKSEKSEDERGDDSAKPKDASDEDESSDDDDDSKSEAGGDADVEMEDSQKDASESDESNDENEQEERDENATPKKGKGRDEGNDSNIKEEASPRSVEKKEDSPKKQKRSSDASGLPKKKARLSLLPVPSFANQDLRRIRAIQADLVYASMSEQVRTRLAEVTNEYNAAVRASTDLQNLKHRAQGELNRIMLANRNAAHKKKRDYALEMAIARAKWQRDREVWDGKSNARKVKRQQLAEQEAAYVQRGLMIPDGIVRATVGCTLMDAVSAVERRAHQVAAGAQRPGGVWATYMGENEEYESFVPPSMDGVDGGSLDPNRLSKQQEEEEAQKRKEIYHVTLKFNAAEEERKRVWRKMLKIKAEFDPAASRGRGSGAGAIVDVPLPVLRGSGKVYAAQQLPQYTPLSPAQVAATVKKRVPAPRQPRAEGGSAPADKYKGKYSIDRVKERIFPDGSVMPVQMPKKNKDGLYQRPAGRRRKGMEWDAVMGRWIPTGS